MPENSEDRANGFDCNGIFCTGHKTSRCMIAKQIVHQARKGSCHPAGPDVWPKANWKSYTEAAEVALTDCAHPEQLTAALDTNPIFAEDLKP